MALNTVRWKVCVPPSLEPQLRCLDCFTNWKYLPKLNRRPDQTLKSDLVPVTPAQLINVTVHSVRHNSGTSDNPAQSPCSVSVQFLAHPVDDILWLRWNMFNFLSSFETLHFLWEMCFARTVHWNIRVFPVIAFLILSVSESGCPFTEGEMLKPWLYREEVWRKGLQFFRRKKK